MDQPVKAHHRIVFAFAQIAADPERVMKAILELDSREARAEEKEAAAYVRERAAEEAEALSAEVVVREQNVQEREQHVMEREVEADRKERRFAVASEEASAGIQERLQRCHIKETDLNEQLSDVKELRELVERERADLARSQAATDNIKQDYERRIAEIRQIAASGGA